MSGGSGVGMIVVREDGLTILGDPACFRSEQSGDWIERRFCRECGFPLFAKGSRSAGYVSIDPVSLDDGRWLNPPEREEHFAGLCGVQIPPEEMLLGSR